MVVAAAGNNGDTARTYPAACTDGQGRSTVISVAASDHEDDRASFSTYSRSPDHWVSLAAPGQDIFGILPSVNCNISASASATLNLKAGKRSVSGSVSSDSAGSGGSGGACTHPKGKC